ncbi:MAG: acyl-CoA desaturase [Taibaiella sp.]|nr:acyl-CoA desaturase [Taibaiella sp.]
MGETGKKVIVKFAPKGADSFYDEVKARVNAYFTDNNISHYSNSRMYWKTAAMLSMYFVPYALIVSGLGSINIVLFYLLWLVMGAGIVGIGTSIMHDSNHGAYSDNKALNNFLGSILNVIGGYAKNWRIQHNILHHTYTNIEGLDEDIEAGAVLRMSPEKPLRGFHRYQHIYAWFVYCIMNIYWVTVKDFKNLIGYHKNGLLVKQKISLGGAVTELILLKLLYVGYMVAIPILFSKMPWYHVVGGLLAMHVVAGLALACIFQPAHVIETSDYAKPDDKRKMENSWAVHQVLNTADFAQNNKLVSWFIGGLNFQIEHHLFPHICHVHYPEIARIVRSTATEHGIPYVAMPTFRSAIVAHGRMLRKLGRNENL